MQLIPRMVWLDPSGKQLLQWPIHELDMLRRDNVHERNVKLKTGDIIEIKRITAAQVCILCICYSIYDQTIYDTI